MNLRNLPQYEKLEQKYITDIQSEGYYLRHKKSGARILILENEDENKVFNIAFRTTPKDSTGVAHILEHSVLCGSRLFPAKDPFVELVKGSLNTFLNAMTYPDKTMYPVASCNDQDFKNLMHVYLDAVFYPNIYQKEEIFLQEGWNYELEDARKEIVYNGVVYNEMKGVYSSPEDVLEREIMNALFPDTTYGVESGGDPRHIPELTYEDFLAFHKTYYHPSNSYLYLYGKMDFEERLQWLDEHYLSAYETKQIDSEIKKQKPFEKQREIVRWYPVSEEDSTENQTYLAWNAVVGESTDVELSNAFAVLDYALVCAPGARLKQALLDAGIGKDIMSSYESGICQPIYSIIAKNANPEQKEQFESVICDTLMAISREGVDQKALLAGINMMEFKFREADYGSYPKGLIYGIDLFDSWLYDETKPFDYLQQLEIYQKLKKKVTEGYFETLIQQYLLKNSHKSIVVLSPRQGMTTEEERRTRETLQAYKQSLSEEEIQKLVEKTKKLRKFQETPSTEEELKKIPMLERSDIRREILPFVKEEIKIAGHTSLLHDIKTNGIAYLSMLFDASELGQEEICYLALLKSMLGMVDTEHYGYRELNHEINANTGGITPGISVYPILDEKNSVKIYFGIKISALYEKIPFAFEMTKEMLLYSRFEDDKRMKEILSQLRSRLSMHLNSAGHVAAATRAMSYFSENAILTDQISGIAFCRFLENLEDHYETRKEEMKEKMSALCRRLFCRSAMFADMTLEPEAKEETIKQIELLYEALPAAEKGRKRETEENREPKKEGFLTPGQVQFVARAGNYLQEGYSYTGVLRILKVIMSYEYLWVNVRVKGGAYGCMSSFGRNGDTYFVSYRDPNLGKTNQVYEGIPEFLHHFTVSERDMTKYIIGTISEMDVPMTPKTQGQRSLMAYLCHITEKMLQKERNEVLNATQESIRDLEPLVKAVLKQNYLCAIGNEEKIRKEKELFESISPLLAK